MSSFRRLTISTLVAVYLLILVGGIVRSTGSGMGCPDWPKCFGNWMPPASVEELPQNYKEIYAEHRHKKNQRFAQYLTAFGMEETANKILTDPSILRENDFNPGKTWIEYGNRVVGVIIGFLIFAVFLVSLRLRKTHPKLTIVALASLLLVGFQGWLGSFVVSTNLTPWTVTLHMFLAMVIVAFLVYLINGSRVSADINSAEGYWLVMACMSVLLVQILLGTQVREAIDQVAMSSPRTTWIAGVFETFSVHRTFSWVVLLVHVALIFKFRKIEGSGRFAVILTSLIVATIATGAGMAYFGVPPFLQPLHLLIATVTFGMQFLLWLRIRDVRCACRLSDQPALNTNIN